MVGAPRREGGLARKVGKMIGKTSSMNGKSPSVPREVDENAVAAAKLFFNQGGRKPVDFCGREAQAARRLRGDGQENAGIGRP